MCHKISLFYQSTLESNISLTAFWGNYLNIMCIKMSFNRAATSWYEIFVDLNNDDNNNEKGRDVLGGPAPVVIKCPEGPTPGVKLLAFTSKWLATTWAGLSLVIMMPLLVCCGAGCSVIDPPSGPGEPSLERDSGVINPDIPAWFGDEGALRLKKKLRCELNFFFRWT